MEILTVFTLNSFLYIWGGFSVLFGWLLLTVFLITNKSPLIDNK